MADQSTTLAEMRAWLARFVAEREWQSYHDPKNLAMSVAIEAAELMEHFQWVRSDELATLASDPARREAIGEEIADVACYLLSLCNAMQLDLSDAVKRKIAKNATKYPIEKFKGRYTERQK